MAEKKTMLKGPRYRAVKDATGEIRLWYRRSKHGSWVGFCLNFEHTSYQDAPKVFRTLAEANRFLELVPHPKGPRGSGLKGKVFSDREGEIMDRILDEALSG